MQIDYRTKQIELDPQKYRNIETGEILQNEIETTNYEFKDSCETYLFLKKYSPYFKMTKTHNFVKYFPDEINKVIPSISLKNLGYFIRICHNLNYCDNVCLNFKYEAHTNKSLAFELGISPQRSNSITKDLEKSGLLKHYRLKGTKYNRKKVFIVNPKYLRKGKDINEDIINMFNNSKGRFNHKDFCILDQQSMFRISKEGLTFQAIGFTLVLSTYLSKEKNILNINSKNLFKTFRSLGISKIQKRTFDNYLANIMESEVLFEFKKNKYKRNEYYLNPSLIRRGNKFPKFLMDKMIDYSEPK